MARGKKRASNSAREALQNTQTAALIWLGLALVIGIVLFLTYYMKNKKLKKGPRPGVGAATIGGNVGEPEGVVAAEMAGGRRRTRTARQRMIRRRQDDDDYDDFYDEDFDDDDGPDQIPWGADDQGSGKIGTKKLRKLQEKAEKRAQREEEQQEREDRKRREKQREEERKQEEERQKIEQAQREEEERLKKEEQERKEHEEYLLLKESFTVEDSGEAGIISEEEANMIPVAAEVVEIIETQPRKSQALLQEFIDYVMETKVVMLEDLASQFGLRVQEAIQRLEDLQEMGRLTGVMDDRGKFIYISQEELNNVARYIKQRGRVAISDLAESSNTLISLQGKKPTAIKDGHQNLPVEATA